MCRFQFPKKSCLSTFCASTVPTFQQTKERRRRLGNPGKYWARFEFGRSSVFRRQACTGASKPNASGNRLPMADYMTTERFPSPWRSLQYFVGCLSHGTAHRDAFPAQFCSVGFARLLLRSQSKKRFGPVTWRVKARCFREPPLR